jgi:hypothetical protein
MFIFAAKIELDVFYGQTNKTTTSSYVPRFAGVLFCVFAGKACS